MYVISIIIFLLQIFGYSSRSAILEGVRNYALGFVGLAIAAGLANFIAVCVVLH